ncbi:M14 family metallopeptidase [Planctomycetaceae bacterium SH139]
MSTSYFSATYVEARGKFRAAAEAVAATLFSYPVAAEHCEDLTIDVAVLGPADAPALVTSSGVHGVEGFLGSAAQVALLTHLQAAGLPGDLRYVLIHGVNPYGFSRLRRFNEENIDLNRNFLLERDGYRGSPTGYARLDPFLNPTTPPAKFELFRLKAIGSIWRHGLQALKQAIAGGQYEYPRGIFFGGRGPAESTRVIAAHCDDWIADAARIVHLDFHTGLGPFATYKLLLDHSSEAAADSWYARTFGREVIDAPSSINPTAYATSGGFGEWLQHHFASREYRFVTAEFGTYGVLRVLGAIREENRAHHHGSRGEQTYWAAKAELLECFCPRDQVWRDKVMHSSAHIIAQAATAIWA